MAAKQSKIPSTYFRKPSIAVLILVTFALSVLLLAWLAPTSTPTFVYQPLAAAIAHYGTTYAFWLNVVMVVVIAIHVLEVACAVTLSYNYGLTLGTTVLWALQTAVFGYLSLGLLVDAPAKFSKSKRS